LNFSLIKSILRKEADMNLKKATLLAIIAICYEFALRTVGTAFPFAFRNLTVAQVTNIISFLASLGILLFFIYFYKDYVQKEETGLKNASVFAIIGSGLMSLLLFKGLIPLFNPNSFGYLLRPHFIEPTIPWVSSILILIFFIVFNKLTIQKEEVRLRNATLSGVLGSLIGVLLRTFTLIFYLFSSEISWFFDLPKKMHLVFIIFLPITLVGFVLMLFFFLVFYKEQKE